MKKKQTLGTFISKNIIYIAFVIMLIGLSVFTSSFLQMKNLVNVLRQATVVGVLSMGMTFVIIEAALIFPSVLRWRLLPALPRLIRLRRLRFRFLWRSRWAVWLVLLLAP